MPNLLHLFTHGLGDCVGFTAVLRHLRKHQPEYTHFVCAYRGRHTAFGGLAESGLVVEELDNRWANMVMRCHTQEDMLSISTHLDPKMDKIIVHKWPECPHSMPSLPSTKAAYCLKEVFGIEPEPELLSYQIRLDPEPRTAVDRYLNSLPLQAGFRYAVIHYQGHTSQGQKELHDNEALEMCEFLAARGIVPIILDWQGRSKIPDGVRFFCPDVNNPLWRGIGTGCAQAIAALMTRAAVTVCIDSGPGKVALAVPSTPALQIWRHLHPLHYCDYAPHAIHLVPNFHHHHIHADRDVGRKFFDENYRYVTYKQSELGRLAGELAWRMASGYPLTAGKEAVDSVPVHGPALPAVGRSPSERTLGAFAVGIPTLNRYNLLEKCLMSIADSTLTPSKVFIVDNGGSMLRDWWTARYNVEIISPQKNLGVASSWNLMHQLAKPLPLILMNDDVVLDPGAFARILGVDAPLVLAPDWSCFHVSEKVWSMVGEFDEAFHCYHEDDDYRWRCKLLGMTPFVMDAGVVHMGGGSQTTKAMTDSEQADFKRQWEAGHQRYARKWGSLPGREIFNKPFNGE